MGYGIEITGADGGGDFIVQDTELNMINYQITASGQASTVARSLLEDSNNNIAGRLFVNGDVSGTTGDFVTLIESGGNYNFYKVNYTYNNQNLENLSLTSCNVNYIILKKMSSISTSGENYGIQLFTNANTNPSTVAFDSRRILTDSSFYFSESRGATTVSGNFGLISTDGDSYIDIECMFTDISTATLSEGATGVAWYSNNNIMFLNFFNQHGRDPNNPNSTITGYRSNFNTLILGKLY